MANNELTYSWEGWYPSYSGMYDQPVLLGRPCPYCGTDVWMELAPGSLSRVFGCETELAAYKKYFPGVQIPGIPSVTVTLQLASVYAAYSNHWVVPFTMKYFVFRNGLGSGYARWVEEHAEKIKELEARARLSYMRQPITYI